MSNTDAFGTHSFSDAIPHIITQEGKTIFHQRCIRCGRDFAQSLNGGGWRAVYVGVLRIELLAECVNRRWLTEECPKRYMFADNDDRAMRAS
jgi:hypothetical protein